VLNIGSGVGCGLGMSMGRVYDGILAKGLENAVVLKGRVLILLSLKMALCIRLYSI